MARRVVWILGAGFSMPLGGPSLASLLTLETERVLSEAFPPIPGGNDVARENVVGKVASITRWLYQYGTCFPASGGQDTNRTRGESLWTDAEDFFDKLDRAALAPDAPLAKRLVSIVVGSRHGMHVPVSQLRDTAKRLLAFECARFLDGQDPGQEPWLPYVRWARLLVAQAEGKSETAQTVITFNYDAVPERLRLQPYVVLPGATPQNKVGLHVLKLHGSTNWRYASEAQGDVVVTQDANFAATCAPWELAIAAPGPGKQQQAQRFQDLWDYAAAALKAAGAVVFLGYRIPPTDARSRRFLLENLPLGRIPIHVVLGHDTNGPDARRMKGLLEMARPQAVVDLLPLFGQDYLDAYSADDWDRLVASSVHRYPAGPR